MLGEITLVQRGEHSTLTVAGQLRADPLVLRGSIADFDGSAAFPAQLELAARDFHALRVERREKTLAVLDSNGRETEYSIHSYEVSHLRVGGAELHEGIWVVRGQEIPFVLVDDPIAESLLAGIGLTGLCFAAVKAANMVRVCSRRLRKHHCPNNASSHAVSSKTVARLRMRPPFVECHVECAISCLGPRGERIAQDIQVIGIG